jgi:hypothetical protein
MWQPSKPVVYGLGLFVTAHPIAACYGRADSPDALLAPPPIAALMVPISSGSVSVVHVRFAAADAITDDRYPVADWKHDQVTIRSS